MASYWFDDKTKKIERDYPENHELNALYLGGCICEKPCAKVINLLVMGQTGAGKTTYVDALVNQILGVEFFDKFRYKLVDEKDLIKERTSKANQAMSD